MDDKRGCTPEASIIWMTVLMFVIIATLVLLLRAPWSPLP